MHRTTASTLEMEVIHSSETSADNLQTPRRQDPQDHNRYLHHSENVECGLFSEFRPGHLLRVVMETGGWIHVMEGKVQWRILLNTMMKWPA